MNEPKFILHPNIADSITFKDMVEFFGLDPADCVEYDPAGDNPRGLRPLHALPSWMGKSDWSAAILRIKVEDFSEYQRAVKLKEMNEGRGRKEFATINQKKMDWLAKTWPDFPEAYGRLHK